MTENKGSIFFFHSLSLNYLYSSCEIFNQLVTLYLTFLIPKSYDFLKLFLYDFIIIIIFKECLVSIL